MPSLDDIQKKLASLSKAQPQKQDDEDATYETDSGEGQDPSDAESVVDAGSDRKLTALPPTSTDAPSEIDALKTMRDKFTGKSTVDPGMNTSDAISTLLGDQDSRMKAAMQAQNNMQLLAMLNHAGNTIGSAFTPLSHVRPDESNYQALMQAANKPVQMLDAQNAKQDKLFALKETLDAKREAERDRNEIKKLTAQSKLDDATSKRDEKTKETQSKAYTQARKDLESFRGNKQVQQAANDSYSAAKALSLVNDRDPNTLTTQDLSLLNHEIAKIATGGVPGEHGVQSLMPSNLRTRAAELKNFLLSKPSDAQAGEYIKRNMKYLQGMVDEADRSVKKYRNNILKGYKQRIRPEDLDEAMNDYNLNEDKTEKKNTSGKSNQMEPPHGMTVVQNGHTYNWNPETGKYE